MQVNKRIRIRSKNISPAGETGSIAMKKSVFVISFISVLGLLLFCFLAIWNGIFLLNNPSKTVYPVRGVDVSSYQGEINWDTLAAQGISFAFIKATEGSSYIDPKFTDNYRQAHKTNLRIGAYHFFSFDSAGNTQAENFMSTVEKTEDMLPPVIDLEFYADKEKNPPDRESVREQLQVMLDTLERHYGAKPILYATEKSYSLYLSGAYEAYDIWIRDVIASPDLSDGREWRFWQYTNRARLNGYAGQERYIDMNVFNGTAEEFKNYAK